MRPNPPPLTRDDLLAIQARNKGNPDVRSLLMEVKRLRALVLRSHDVLRLAEAGHSVAPQIAPVLKQELDQEPVVLEQQPVAGD